MAEDLFMPPEHAKVLATLAHCQGRAQAVSNAQLAEITGLPERKLRQVIRDLVQQFGAPIGTAYGSREGGHYTIASDQERQDTVAKLLAHGANLLKRAHSLDRAAARQVLGQLEMDLT